MDFVVVNANGQITLPAQERKKLGIGPGSTLSLVERDRGLFIKPAKIVGEGIFDKIEKIAKAKNYTSDDIVKMCREVRKEVYEEEYGT